MEGKNLRDLDAAISNLSRSLSAYYAGDPYAHLPVSVELRKLLCEQRRSSDESLVLRDNENFALHPLRTSSLPIDGPNVFLFRGPMHFDGRVAGHLGCLFDEGKPLMRLREWLEQPLVSQTITIRDLIKSVADKEGAHADKELNETLALLQSVRLGGRAGVDAENLVSIGHYVLRNLVMRRMLGLREQLLAFYKVRRESEGSGALRLRLSESLRPYSDGLVVDFVTADEARQIGSANEGKRAADLMSSHAAETSLLLWLVDLQSHVWFSEVRL